MAVSVIGSGTPGRGALMQPDQRKMAEEARAAADQAYNQKMGLNTEDVALQAIQMQRDVCAKGGCTFLFGGNATPLLNLRP